MRSLIFFFSIFYGNYVLADLAIDRTRVIIDEVNKSGYFSVRNTGTTPVLVQSWVSEYSTDIVSEDVTVIPPLFRIFPGEIKTVRVESFTNEKGKVEKLSLINIQQIPINHTGEEKNNISLSIRMVFKLLIRGKEFILSDMGQRINYLDCSVQNKSNDSTINCINSSGYNFIVGGISDIKQNRHLDVENELIKPFTRTSLSFPGKISIGSSLELVDDSGHVFSYMLKGPTLNTFKH